MFNLDGQAYKSKDHSVIQGHVSRVTTIITFKTALLAKLSREKTSAEKKDQLQVNQNHQLDLGSLANWATQAGVLFTILQVNKKKIKIIIAANKSGLLA